MARKVDNTNLFECSTSFTIGFSSTIDASISVNDVSVSKIPGSDRDYAWSAGFLYTIGHPPATAFRLNSADGLSGSFDPRLPQGDSPQGTQSGSVAGVVRIPEDTEGNITYGGTITIIQE